MRPSRILCLLLSICYSAYAGEFQDDLKARRNRVMERLGPEAMLILWSAPTRAYSLDVNYEYRQDSNLYYLTGIDQEETALVLMPGNRTRKEILFVSTRDPKLEHWTGRALSLADATSRSGIAKVYPAGRFDSFIYGVLSRFSFDTEADEASSEYEAFFKALDEGKARLALPLRPRPGLSQPLNPVFEFANKIRQRFFNLAIQDATKILANARQIKTPYERKLLERSVDISNQAQLAAMRAARPGAYEYQVKAAIEQTYKANGAQGWSYPPIVGSGPNATILHYEKSDRQMQSGDLLLVDAACNYEYLTGDITRTYPVDGTFSPAQKDIYEIVLAAQEEAIKVSRPGVKLKDVEKKAAAVVKEGLLRLGLITDASNEQYKTWYTHNACHYIGIDVHDVGDYERPLEPGMTFVIEPGLYIRKAALDDLPKTPENEAFRSKVQSTVEKYNDIGTRIEDSFLLTESGLENLSASVPRTVAEIERFLKGRPPVPPVSGR